MALYVFLDEAGNLRDDRDLHGVLVAFVTDQPKATRKCFVRAKQAKIAQEISALRRDQVQRSGDPRCLQKTRFATNLSYGNPNLRACCRQRTPAI